MRGWRGTVLGLATAAMVACGGGGEAGADYSAEAVEQFLASCTAGGTSEAVCQCALDKFEAKYTEEEFVEEGEKLAAGEPSEDFTADLFAYSSECAQEAG